MSLTLSKQAWEKLIDEDIEWLMKQPRTLERWHIHECLLWLKKNKALVDSTRNPESPQP